MISEIFIKGIDKAGNQDKLAQILGIPQQHISSYKNYNEKSTRKPNDEIIGQLAEYVGLDPIATILECKKETDKEKATLWQKWLSNSNLVRSAGLEPTPQASETCTLSS